jgi:hypothetical protein
MRTLILVTLLLSVPAAISAIPIWTPEFGTIPPRIPAPRQNDCHLQYYNWCSGWAAGWTAYCGNFFHNGPPGVQYGTCFNLSDCPGDCRQLESVWYACSRFTARGWADVEIYCADDLGCPIGSPLAGIYGYQPDFGNLWQHLDFGGVPLCSCEGQGSGKFIVMITDYTAGTVTRPISDLNSYNVDAGCETEWRCDGTHSYVYHNRDSYCQIYGAPGPLWMWSYVSEYGCTNYPPIPEGCHGQSTGFFAEWLIDCYVSCEGPTETEKDSWSEIKALYR